MKNNYDLAIFIVMTLFFFILALLSMDVLRQVGDQMERVVYNGFTGLVLVGIFGFTACLFETLRMSRNFRRN